tara:strand:+ start:549 stop:869 length:321 start_codon:yes stop_codon:yes gene_type:complete
MKIIHTQKARIGQNKQKKRVCLWNPKLVDAGFDYGVAIATKQRGNMLTITPSAEPTRRKVSRVMNHGKPLPVLDLRGELVENLGNVGDSVSVVITKNKITITGAKP